MKLTEDTSKFDAQQISLLKEIISSIKRDLEEANLDQETINNLVPDLSFSLCAIIDGSTIMEHNGSPLLPFLGFSDGEVEKNITYSDRGTWMHEYAMGLAEEALDNSEEIPSTEKAPVALDLAANDKWVYAVTLCFASGIKQAATYWHWEEVNGLWEGLCDVFSETISGGVDSYELGGDEIIKELGTAFQSIEKIEFWNDEEVEFTMTGDDFSSLSIKELSGTINRKLRTPDDANKAG